MIKFGKVLKSCQSVVGTEAIFFGGERPEKVYFSDRESNYLPGQLTEIFEIENKEFTLLRFCQLPIWVHPLRVNFVKFANLVIFVEEGSLIPLI